MPFKIYILVLDIFCQQGVYVIWWVPVRTLGAGLWNVNFLKYKFILDIYCQRFNDLYFGIGYMLPTMGGLYSASNWGIYVIFGGCLLPVRHLGQG